MGCILPIIALFTPRLLLFFIWVLTTWPSIAFKTYLWPFLGFIFMPYTTLTYMAAMLNNDGCVCGIWIFVVFGGFIFDIIGTLKSLDY